MKKIAFFSLFFVMAFYAGCSTVKFSPTQNITQTCPANLNSNSESKEKQCCLKDTLNITVKPVVETCKPDSVKDNSGASTNIEVNPKVKYAPKKSLDINGKVKVQNQEVNDFGTGCFGQNCEINNIYIESKDEEESNIFISCLKRISSLKKFYYNYLIILGFIFFFFLTAHYLIPTIIYLNSLLKRLFCHQNHSIPLKNNSYEILSPYISEDILFTKDGEETETKKQLNFAIINENEQIKNIALTGPYGSGKSSIWESFCKFENISKRKQKVSISFANFKNTNENETNDKFTEYEIERVIIQQLIYSKDNKALKYSSFQKIKDISDFKIATLAFFHLVLFSVVLSIIAILRFSELTESKIYCIINNFPQNDIITKAYTIIILSFLYYITFWVVQKFNKIKISKFCINNIELTFDENNSLFDKFLNEIVYFFEATKTNLVVIEDLDRFDSSLKIFTKLRELNKLINSYPPTKNSVKFVYLVRDDILSKYERTKFFDYIIPVIPKLSINNSASVFKKEIDSLKEKGKIINLNIEYLMNIQDFLKDFRLLKNCINEFFIYQNEIDGIKNKSLLFQYESFKRNNKTINIDELIDEKTFSLILYKNLYPKDFSKLEKKEGILFKCLKEINNILDIKENNRTNKSIKEILKKHDNDETRKKFKTRIEILNDEFNYNETERVDSLLLYTLLIKGYIEDDFEMLIKKNNEAILSYPEQEFLFNVKNDIPASQFLYLREENLHYICIQIIDYQWNSPGILNNIIIDYILKGTEPDCNTKASKIVEAMYNFDSYRKTYDKFIPQYFEHCSKENINTYPLLNAIEDVLSDLSSGHSENDLEDEYTSEEIGIFESVHFLGIFFKEISTFYFNRFLVILNPESISLNETSAIIEFLDDKNNESFKEELFDKSYNFNDLISSLEENGIYINLTPHMCNKLKKNYSKIPYIYKINKSNIDIILKENNKSTNEQYYLTQCLRVDDLNDIILNKTKIFFYIFFDFKNVEEDYSSLKVFFDANNRLKSNIDESSIKNYLQKISPKWEKFVIYNRYTSFDDYLSKSIKDFLLSDNLNQQISNDLKNDETCIKEFVRAVIKKSNIDNKILLQLFLPFWGKYVSILNCYEGEEQEIQNMTSERNHLLQQYTIDNTINRPSEIMIELMINEPAYFIENYPEEEYVKDSKFKLSVLNSDSENLIEIKRRFFKNISENTLPEEDVNTYKKAGKQIKIFNPQNRNFILGLSQRTNSAIHDMKTILNLKEFDSVYLDYALIGIRPLTHGPQNTDDPWSILLFNNLSFWAKVFRNFIDKYTTTLDNGNRGLKEPDRNDEKNVNERNAEYQNIVKKLEFWLNELDEYIKEFK